MKQFILLFVSLSFIGSSSLAAAQASAPQKQRTISDLIEQGSIERAISVLQEEALASERSAAERGRTYAMLGYAYKEQGKFEAALPAFNRAIDFLEAAGDPSTDLSATLDFYAGTLMSLGDLEAAATALHKAAKIDSRLGNHAGLALIETHTADLDIERRKYKEAKKALDFARAEAALAHGFATATQPEIDDASAWLALSTGKFHEAVLAYSASLEENRQQFGENTVTTGWSYLLLGRAQEQDHDLAGAAQNMDKGLAILKATVGTNHIRYLAGELAYSELLERAGSHAEAARLSSAANLSIRSLGLPQCAACTVSVWTLLHEAGR